MSIETLVFNNVEVLSYKHENKFFGNKSFSYSALKTLSIKGYVLDLLNFNGSKNIFNQTEEIKQLANNFHNIIINNEIYGTGKIKSLSFDPGNWVRTTLFNADIEIYEEVPLQNLGTEFSNIDLNNKNIFLLSEFSENFNLNFDVQNKILGGEHKIDITYDANNTDVDILVLAKRLAQELLKTLPSSVAKGNYNTRPENSYRTLKNESYDLVNGKCGFTKTFSYSTNYIDKTFSINRTISINMDELGEVSVQENCKIKAENNIPSLYNCALNGLNDVTEGIQNSYTRCLEVFDRYKQSNRFDITISLNSEPIEKNITINKFDGTIDYTVTFDNDKKKLNTKYIFEKTSTLDRDQNWIWTISERGSIDGRGLKYDLINNLKYKNAEEGWSTIKNNIFNNLNTLWTTHVKSEDRASSSLKLISRNVSRQPSIGKIDYTYNYSDDPRINPNSDIRKIEINVNDDGNTGNTLKPIFKEYLIPNKTRSLIQNLNLKQQGTYQISISAEITLPGQNDVFNGFSYFDRLKNLIPNGGGNYQKYLESIDYQTDEIEQTASLNASYKYSS